VRSTRRGEERAYSARHVILAIGGMHEPLRLSIPGEDLPHVSHFFDEAHRYFRERLLIVGGRNSAAETAVRCARAGARVTLSYRGAKLDPAHVKYWILPELEGLIRRRDVVFHPLTVPVAIRPGSVSLAPAAGGEPRLDVPADFVLLLTGYVMDTSLLLCAGAAIDGENRKPKLDPATMMTTVPSLYVAGVAVAGTQHGYRLFIENCHPHVTKIVKSITGEAPPPGLVNDAVTRFDLPES
jgi:thioredoxin reductase (NADPH)